MAKTITQVIWEKEMMGINGRLGRLLLELDRILKWADGDDDLADPSRWPRMDWGVERDQRLLMPIGTEWMPAVNALMQRRVKAEMSADQTAKLLAELMFMRSPTNTDAKSVETEYGDMELTFIFNERARNLFSLHAEQALLMKEGEPWEGLRKRQESEANARFPKMVREDTALLNELVYWRRLTMTGS